MNENWDLRSPFLSRKNVTIALEHLFSVGTLQSFESTNPLAHLQIIDEMLMDSNFPITSRSREYAVQHLLTSIIAEQLNLHRAIEGLPAIQSNETREEAAGSIQTDAATQSRVLSGWSILYYRFVRADLAISGREYGTIGYFNRRTINRQQTSAITKLTDLLIEKEWETRKKYRKQRLHHLLPRQYTNELVGRDNIIEFISEVLYSPKKPKHIYIFGPPGIGKSALVRRLVSDLIDSETIYDLCWINNPRSVANVQNRLNTLLLPDYNIQLQRYLESTQACIILDSIEAFLDQEGILKLNQLLAEFSSATVLLIGSHYQMHINSHSFRLDELSQRDSLTLADAILRSSGLRDERAIRDFSMSIAVLAKGNPELIRITARRTISEDHTLDTHPKIIEYYDLIAKHLPLAIHHLWHILSLLPKNLPDIQNIAIIWNLDAIDDQIQTLIEYGLLETSPNDPSAYFVPSSACTYHREKYRTDARTKDMIDWLIEKLLQAAKRQNRFALTYLENLVLNNLLSLDTQDIREWSMILYSSDVWNRNSVQWSTVFDREFTTANIEEDDWVLAIICVRCLRQNQEWLHAEYTLQEIIQKTGNSGHFLWQAYALFEKSLLVKHRGEYTLALELLHQASYIASLYSNSELVLMSTLEKAQIGIDAGDPQLALELLMGLPQTQRTTIIMTEAFMLSGDFEKSLQIATNALPLGKEQPTDLGALHDLVGRCHAALGNVRSAQYHLGIAITIFERSNNFLGLGRTQSNLAALLLRRGEAEEARLLGLRARKLQELYGDKLGLIVTEHNLHCLNALW